MSWSIKYAATPHVCAAVLESLFEVRLVLSMMTLLVLKMGWSIKYAATPHVCALPSPTCITTHLLAIKRCKVVSLLREPFKNYIADFFR